MALLACPVGGAFAAPIVTAIGFSNGSSAVGNTASSGGVIYAQRLSSLLIESSTISANRASQDGGVVVTETLLASVVIKNSQLLENAVKLGSGGVLAMRIPEPVSSGEVAAIFGDGSILAHTQRKFSIGPL
jgi:hypothetical protein